MSCSFVEVLPILRWLLPYELNGLRILDVGCGYGFWGWALRSWKKSDSYLVGLDINPEYLRGLKDLNVYDELILADVVKTLPTCSFDLIIASHIVEHLEKEDGLQLLERLKRQCRGFLIVCCPEGGKTGTGSEHLSVWREHDFKELGFTTRHYRFSHPAGRVVELFERFYFWVRGWRSGGALVAWIGELR